MLPRSYYPNICDLKGEYQSVLGVARISGRPLIGNNTLSYLMECHQKSYHHRLLCSKKQLLDLLNYQ